MGEHRVERIIVDSTSGLVGDPYFVGNSLVIGAAIYQIVEIVSETELDIRFLGMGDGQGVMLAGEAQDDSGH